VRSREAEQFLRLEAEKALAEEKQTIALKMLRKNMDLQTIAEVTGLTIAQIENLQSQSN
jgi:predicted transposase YdaD